MKVDYSIMEPELALHLVVEDWRRQMDEFNEISSHHQQNRIGRSVPDVITSRNNKTNGNAPRISTDVNIISQTGIGEVASVSELIAWVDEYCDKKKCQPLLDTYAFILDGARLQIHCYDIDRDSTTTTSNPNNNHRRQGISSRRLHQISQQRPVLAQSILERMTMLLLQVQKQQISSSRVDVLPSEVSQSDHQKRNHIRTLILQAVHKVMKAYCDANDVASAERVLNAFEQLAFVAASHMPTAGSVDRDATLDLIPLPSPDTYTIILSAYAKNGRPREAELVLNRTLLLGLATKENFESCLNAWVKSKDIMAGHRAESLLLQMEDNQHSRTVSASKTVVNPKIRKVAPTLRNFAKVVNAWVESRHKDAALRAEAVLQLMHQLDWAMDRSVFVECYVKVIKGWALSKSLHGPDKIRDLVHNLTTMVGGWSKISSADAKSIYFSLLTVWARFDRSIAVTQVETIFRDMKQRRQEGQIHFDIDVTMYNILLSAYAKAGDAVKAEQLLSQMHRDYLSGVQSSKPDTKSFNAVLLAWGNLKGHPYVAQSAEKLFVTMQQLQGREGLDLTPDIVTYNALLAAMGTTHDVNMARRAMQYFDQVKQSYRRSRDPLCRPTTVTYNQAIRVWSHIPTDEAAIQVQAILDEMTAITSSVREQHQQQANYPCRPDVNTFRAVLTVLHQCNIPDKYQRIKRVQGMMYMHEQNRRHRF